MIEKPRIHKFLVWRNIKLDEIDLPAFGFRCFRDGDLFLIIKADAYGRLEEIILAKEVDVPVDEAAARWASSLKRKPGPSCSITCTDC